MLFDAVLGFIWEVFFYFIGHWSLRAVTLGRYKGNGDSSWVSLFGLFVVIAFAVVLVTIWKL